MTVFVGPTLAPDELPDVEGLQYLPPASLGDITRVTAHHPKVIGLIDGFFEHRPPVWHKEILWALELGIHVVGAASMGALRAAELHPFGMEGVGTVFDDFASGRLVRDDEVAVTHTVEGNRFIAVSEALVNVRASVAAAHSANVIDEAFCRQVVEVAASTFYRDRRWDVVFESLLHQGGDRGTIDRLQTWLEDNSVDVKRSDALSLVDRVIELGAGGQGPKSTSFTFSRTRYWADLRGYIDNETDLGELANDAPVLEELQLRPKELEQIRMQAMTHRLALHVADHQNSWPEWSEVQQRADELRYAHGLLDSGHMDDWLHHNELDTSDARSLLLRQARVDRIVAQSEGRIRSVILDVLKLEDRYRPLASRAKLKREALRERGLEHPTLEQLGIGESELLDWYLHRLGLDEHTGRTIDEWAEQAGFTGRDHLIDTLAREFAFIELVGEASV